MMPFLCWYQYTKKANTLKWHFLVSDIWYKLRKRNHNLVFSLFFFFFLFLLFEEISFLIFFSFSYFHFFLNEQLKVQPCIFCFGVISHEINRKWNIICSDYLSLSLSRSLTLTNSWKYTPFINQTHTHTHMGKGLNNVYIMIEMKWRGEKRRRKKKYSIYFRKSFSYIIINVTLEKRTE
jgi:hypothetical protein